MNRLIVVKRAVFEIPEPGNRRQDKENDPQETLNRDSPGLRHGTNRRLVGPGGMFAEGLDH